MSTDARSIRTPCDTPCDHLPGGKRCDGAHRIEVVWHNASALMSVKKFRGDVAEGELWLEAGEIDLLAGLLGQVRVIALPRRGGKTTQMLAWLDESQDRVLVTSAREAIRICRLRPDLPAWRIATPDRVHELLQGRGEVVLGIDDADVVLSTLLRGRVVVLSVTADPVVQS